MTLIRPLIPSLLVTIFPIRNASVNAQKLNTKEFIIINNPFGLIIGLPIKIILNITYIAQSDRANRLFESNNCLLIFL